MPILFALVGATGIGKSNFSLELAEHYNAEIIGVDSRQIYKGFSIGTAQPDIQSLNRVRHHLVDFVPPTDNFSAGAFCSLVKNLVAENPEKNFILVGGTGLYLQSLMLGLPKIPEIEPALRQKIEELVVRDGVDVVYKRACEVDPEAMEKVVPGNVQRITRVLEVFESTGRKLSEFQKEREGGVGKLSVFSLQRDRDELYRRINSRVDQMIEGGWVDEARELAKTVPLDAPAWQSLGYRELLEAKSHTDLARIVENVKQKTRNYAKRQLTWFRWQLDCVPIDMENSEKMMTLQSIFQNSCVYLVQIVGL